MDEVIVVNEKDEILGYTDKMEAHKKGILHRAISVFIFNTNGEWLLQKRASHKYHSSDLWSNTACTHPLKDETELEAANRRLNQEMGMTATLK
ncbi:MAG: isopentenyl-diphosphate Delta-isomerase, partial [Flavobacteriales bacterium]